MSDEWRTESAVSNDAAEPESVHRTFCFIDLAGFTALTDAHGDAEAVALLDRFLAMVRDSLGAKDELVKSIGDAVMIACPTPDEAAAMIHALLSRCRRADGFPLPRAGGHHGSALRRGDDYLGGAVNLAARVAAKAGGGEFLATGEVAEAARRSGRVVVPLGVHTLRNVRQPIELFEIRSDEDAPTPVIDPVCRMRLDPANAHGWIRYANTEYWFCSVDCVAVFANDPTSNIPG